MDVRQCAALVGKGQDGYRSPACGAWYTPFGDPKQIEEALDHYDEALKGLWLVKEKAQVPFRWALLQVNRGLALWKLGEKRHDPAILEAAVKAFNDALDVFIATKSDYYVNGVRQHRDRLQNVLVLVAQAPLIRGAAPSATAIAFNSCPGMKLDAHTAAPGHLSM